MLVSNLNTYLASSRSTASSGASAPSPGGPRDEVQLGSASGASASPRSATCTASPAPVQSVPPTAAAPASAPPAAPAPFDLNAALSASRAEAASLEGKLEDYVPGEVLVKLKGGVQAAALTAFANDYGAKVIHHFRVPGVMAAKFGGELLQLQLPAGMSTAQAMAAMGRDGRVAYAEPNFLVKHCEGAKTPADLTDQQWGLLNTGQKEGVPGVDIKATDAWGITTGLREEGPVIAVIDTGIDYTHTDLAPNMWTNPGEVPGDGIDNDGNGIVDDVYGANFPGKNGDPKDDNNHGSHCAGVIGAVEGNGGVVGVNWEARMMALKFLGAGGGGTTADAIKGILYATDKGARITSNSWGGSQFSQACMDAMAASPALHICAAGNDGYDNDTRPSYPANYPLDNVISVAAHDNKDRLASFSNRGAKSVHLAAPGVDIYSTGKDGGYVSMNGTSMATPHVSGVAALIASRYPEADNFSIKSRILSGVDRMPEQYARRLITGGRLNAAKALEDDQVAPAAPSDLRVSAAGSGSVSLAWTATGDDGAQGKAVAYELRFSRSPIAASEDNVKPGEISFEDATPVRVDAPQVSGSGENCTIPLIPSGKERKLYFALRVVDNVGNRSNTSITEARVPSTPVAFEDTFDDQSLFKPEGSWGLVEVPGRGRVWTDSPDGNYGDSRDDAITTNPFSLKDWKNPVLRFEARTDIEKGYDGCEVEVYGKKFWGGHKWRSLGTLEGISDWTPRSFDLSDYEGQEIRLRFRFHSDDSRNRDGVYIDNAVITGDPIQGSEPQDGCFDRLFGH